MRVLFMGTSPFAIPSLRRLNASQEVLAVVTQPDRPQGRGGRVSASPVKEAAVAAGLPVLQPEKVRSKEFVQIVRDLAPDVIVVAAFGQIIPQRVLDIPPFGCLNVHGSLLPRWRGAAPMQYALMAGDTETGVTTMQMDAGLDTGDILQRATLPLVDIANVGELEPRLAELGADLLTETLAALQAGNCLRIPQDQALVTSSPSLPPDAGRLDWKRPALDLHNLVRGVTPKPGAYTFWLGKRLKVLATEPLEEEAAGEPGLIRNVSARGILVDTSKGALLLSEVQPESKARMAAEAWARGARAARGDRFDGEPSAPQR